METKIKRIAVIGLGLIGGSLAMSLKLNGYQVIGITKRANTLEIAKTAKVIDFGYLKLTSEILNDVDIIFIATPLSFIPGYIEEIGKIVKHDLILTDFGSTKFEICKVAKRALPENITFIGGHPMAGTEHAGFLSAQLGLFKKCAWLLTPVDENEQAKKSLTTLKKVINQIGAIPIIADPEKHDMAVALVSHLPLLASIGLCKLVKDLDDKELQKLAMTIASSGFRDTTRIGGCNPELSTDLMTSNLTQLSELLPKYYKELEAIVSLSKNQNGKLIETLSNVSQWRSKVYDTEGKNYLLNKEPTV